VDLGYAADRVFVNNASFGTYGFVVTDPAYRGAKSRTTLRTLPGLLTGEGAPTLRARADGVSVDGLRALLVSNNPYGRVVDAARPGRRERLDSGLLGVVCVRVGNTAQAARRSRAARRRAARRGGRRGPRGRRPAPRPPRGARAGGGAGGPGAGGGRGAAGGAAAGGPRGGGGGGGGHPTPGAGWRLTNV